MAGPGTELVEVAITHEVAFKNFSVAMISEVNWRLDDFIGDIGTDLVDHIKCRHEATTGLDEPPHEGKNRMAGHRRLDRRRDQYLELLTRQLSVICVTLKVRSTQV